MIHGEADEQVTVASMVNLPKTNVVEYLKFVADKLMETERSKLDSHGSNCLQTITEDVRCILNALVELLNQKESLQTLWDRAVQVGSRLDFLGDQLALGDSFPKSIDSIAGDLIALKIDVLKVFDARKRDVQVAGLQEVQPQSSFPDATTEVVGFQKEIKLIKDQLISRSEKLQVIAIVGMPGLGKTTLATKLYNDPTIVERFQVRGWCSVSQELNQRKTLLELLNQTLKGLPNDVLGMPDHDLLDALRRSLKGRRYLILLDDLWDKNAWDVLKASLPDDKTESRILVTSRYNDVVPDDMLYGQKPHPLQALARDECWELLKSKLSLRNESPMLHQLGKEIADSCWGLPLIVVIVAGLLTSQNVSVWKEVLENLTTGGISREAQCANAFRMSYNHLPHYLKPCFLYFGLFPEDNEISVKRLIWLWIAEGLVFENRKIGCLEDVASRYMMDLAGRSLVTVSDKGSMGGAKTCRVHDLLRDFCIARAKEECFFHDLRWSEASTFKEPFYLPRLTIDSRKRDFKDLRLFRPNKQSLLFFPHNEPSPNVVVVEDISFIILVFKHLRVLDIMQIDLGYMFPSEMELPARLRFLAVRGCFRDIPASVGNLSKLETLILHSSNAVTLHPTIWNLQKLRHLCIQNGFHFPVEDLDNCSGLCELESCSTAIISSWDITEKLMEKFSKIRRLKCRVFKNWDTENCNKIRVPDSLSSLTSFHVSLFGRSLLFARVPKHAQFEFSFPNNLKKLTLDHFELPKKEISAIGKLPNLEVLKLLNVAFSEGVFCMLSGEFSSLRLLKLSDSRIVRWTTDDEYTFPPIEHFVLKSCKNLKEIPTCLRDSNTLQLIEVMECSQYVERAVESIKETQQEEYGNSTMKVLISH